MRVASWCELKCVLKTCLGVEMKCEKQGEIVNIHPLHIVVMVYIRG